MVVSACFLALAACATQSENPDSNRLQIPTAPDTQETSRLQPPPLPETTLPEAQTTSPRLQIPTPPVQPSAQPSIAQTEANAPAVSATTNLPADPLLANQDIQNTPITDIKNPAPAALPALPAATREPFFPAAKETGTATNIKKRSVQTDDVSVITWRAERGHIESQLILGTAYANGTLVTQDLEQARLWLELASMQGDRSAQYELGKMYFNGCLLYTSPSPRDGLLSRMPSSA